MGVVLSLAADEDLGTACRKAYVELLVGAHTGWTKVELARWLAGPYRAILASAHPQGEPPASSGVPGVAEERVTRLLATTRADVLLVLHELTASHGRFAFGKLALDTGLVGRDDLGLFVPVARTRMSLLDRVLSLVAVDAFTRPDDFERAFFVCERCQLPAFDASARANRTCSVHVSGVQART